MARRIRLPFLLDVVLVDNPAQMRVLNEHPNVTRARTKSGGLVARGILRRLHTNMVVGETPLPIFTAEDDDERMERQRQEEKRFSEMAVGDLHEQRDAIETLAGYVSGQDADVDVGVVVQQMVGRLFARAFTATPRSYRDSRSVSQWATGGPLVTLWLTLTGGFRRARRRLWELAGHDTHAIHATAIAMHNIVDTLERMRSLASQSPVGRLPETEEMFSRCLVGPPRLLRSCVERTRVPFLRRPMSRGTLIVFELGAMLDTSRSLAVAFLRGEWSQCPAHALVPRLLEEIWSASASRLAQDSRFSEGTRVGMGTEKGGAMSRDEYSVETPAGPVTDVIRKSPVDRDQGRTRARVMMILLVVLAVVAGWAYWRFATDRPVDYADTVEHFKYGSIGSEPGGSLFNPVGGALPPYWVFKALPTVCAEKLPGGFASLGLIFERDEDGELRDLPVGVSRRYRLASDQVGLNCAFCHTGTLRDSPSSERRIIPGMPSHQLDTLGLIRFYLDCTLDERLTADAVVGFAKDSGARMGFFDRFLMSSLVDSTKLILAEQHRRISRAVGSEITNWGPGRVDTFNTYKALQFNWNLHELPLDELIAPTDLPSIWNQKPREGMQLHWDGDNDSVDERNLSASLGAGVKPVTVDHERLKRVREWIWTLPAPEYPYEIDSALASRGETIYRRECLSCHADHRFRDGVVDEGLRVGTVVPLSEIGTDPHRLNSYTPEFAANQNMLYPGTEYRFSRFRKTDGYANQPLDGIWARAPYLHNGSVPTLRDLLEAPESRPTDFYRGYDVYDPRKVGFVSNVPTERGRHYFRFDTSLPGNSNAGHIYGTNLSSEEKDALVEYLKRF